MKKFKLSLDLHGVVDTYPDKFVTLSEIILRAGGEIWICTGSSHTKELEAELLSYSPENKRWWTGIFSIVDYLKSQDIEHIDTPDGGIQVADEIWNRVKGEWAAREDISLHIDDSNYYGEFFPIGVYLKI